MSDSTGAGVGAAGGRSEGNYVAGASSAGASSAGASSAGTGGGGGGVGEPPPDPAPRGPSGPWGNRVSFAETADGLPFAFRPDEVLVLTTRVPEALSIARQLFPNARVEAQPDEATVGPFSRLSPIQSPLHFIEELRFNGIVAQPNHVFFAHDSLTGNPLYGTPLYGTPLYGTPLYGTPLYGTPLYGTPLCGTPFYGSPLYGTPLYGTPLYGSPVQGSKVAGSRHVEPTRSSALPPPRATHLTEIRARIHTDLVAGSPKVIVLDTGLAAPGNRPPFLGSGITPASPADIDHPHEGPELYLEPSAGHGTFIAGVVGQVAPGCEITVHRVLSTFGDGDEWFISQTIHDLVYSDPERTILSLSFGGYVLEHPHLLARTIRHAQHKGVHVVASAGNDATPRPAYPAALQSVVAVGALCPTGPAPFSNFGEWVDACAPGCDLLSSFFVFEGPAPVGPYGDDPDNFDGFAVWSGTSFSAPVVVGNLARMMMADDSSAAAAIKRLIDAPSLTSLPYLGTIVDAL